MSEKSTIPQAHFEQRIFITALTGQTPENFIDDSGDLNSFLSNLELFLTPQLPSSSSKNGLKASMRILSPKYDLSFHIAVKVMDCLYTSYFEGDNRIENQSVLHFSVHRERLKEIFFGCIINDLQSHTKTSLSHATNNTPVISLVQRVLDLLVSIVDKHFDNASWLGNEMHLTRLVLGLMKVHQDEPAILTRCIQYLDNIAEISSAYIAIDADGLQEIVSVCERMCDNQEDVVSYALVAINSFIRLGAEKVYLKYLDRIYSLHILTILMHILQSPLANDDLSIAEAGLSLLATIIEFFAPNAMKTHFEEGKVTSLLLTGSEGFHNLISDLLDLQVEEILSQLITVYLPYSVAVISAAIRVLAVLAPYYEDHPVLLHSIHFGDSKGIRMMLMEWIPHHRVDEAQVAANYLTILFHWTNILHRSIDTLYQLHVKAVTNPKSSNVNSNQITASPSHVISRKNSSLFTGNDDNDQDPSFYVSPFLIAQFTQHTTGKGSLLVPSVRSSFVATTAMAITTTSQTALSAHASSSVLLEKRRHIGPDGSLSKREYEPFSLLGYHHRLVPAEIELSSQSNEVNALVSKEEAITQRSLTVKEAKAMQEAETSTPITLMGVLLKSVLHFCHEFLRESRIVAEFSLRIVFRLGGKSPMAWMQILQAGAVGQIIQCIKAHGCYVSVGEHSQLLFQSNALMMRLQENMVFAEVACKVLYRVISMIDIARYAKYLIVDLQIMEVVAQYLLSSFAFVSKHVLGQGSNIWMTLAEFRTVSLASQRIDVTACDAAVTLLTHYLQRYDTLQQNPFALDDSDELTDVRDCVKLCLLWIDRIVSFEKNRSKLVEMQLSSLLQQILRHHYPSSNMNTNSQGNSLVILQSDFQVTNNSVMEEKLSNQQSDQEWLVIITLQIVRGLCIGIHSGNILSPAQENSAEDQAMRQMLKNGFVPVLLRILTSSVRVAYVRDIVLLSLAIVSGFASKHKLQLGVAGSCEVLHQLLVYDVQFALNVRKIDRKGQVDEEFSESLCHVCTAIYNVTAKCAENKEKFRNLETATLLQQLARAPYCSPICKNELKDAINILRF